MFDPRSQMAQQSKCGIPWQDIKFIFLARFTLKCDLRLDSTSFTKIYLEIVEGEILFLMLTHPSTHGTCLKQAAHFCAFSLSLSLPQQLVKRVYMMFNK